MINRAALQRGACLLLCSLMVACGLPDSGPARTIADDEVPYGLLSGSPAPSEAPDEPGPPESSGLLVFWVDDDGELVRSVPEPRLSQGDDDPSELAALLLEQLVAGPPATERTQGLASALSPGTDLAFERLEGRTAVITLDLGDSTTSAERLPLGIGQVVLTVTSVEGVDAVSFEQDGTAVQAPLPGGALTSDPVTRRDYRSLLAPG